MKLTKQKLQRIIAEEYQKILNEDPNAVSPPAVQGQTQTADVDDAIKAVNAAGAEGGKGEEDIVNKNKLIAYLKTELPLVLQTKTPGITSSEVPHLLDQMLNLIRTFNDKTIDQRRSDTMKKRSNQAAGITGN
jgi:hypothetical protein